MDTPAPPDLERALDLCRRELDRREQTVAQVRRRLERSGVEPTTIEAALAWLMERRYLDDAGYAARFADDRRLLDGWGSQRIARRLAALGVDGALIDALLAARETGLELDAAVAVLRARVKRGSGEDRGVRGEDREDRGEDREDRGEDRARRRALDQLLRRGYEAEVAELAVERFFADWTSTMI